MRRRRGRGERDEKGLRSVLAVLAGVAVNVVLSFLTDLFMRTLKVFPALDQPMYDAQCAIATLYRIVYGVLGSYVIARLAPNRPMGHALVSGVLGLIASTAGVITTRNAMPPLGPRWYALALVITALPCAWAGAKVYEAQQANPQG